MLRNRIVVAAADHGFVDGAQHMRQDRYAPSPFDTVAVLLQNDAGMKAWPWTAEAEAELRVALALAVPNEAALQRRRKAGLYMPKTDKNLRNEGASEGNPKKAAPIKANLRNKKNK